MNREWVTLAFGVALVAAVAVVSVWQNYPGAPQPDAAPVIETNEAAEPSHAPAQAAPPRATANRGATASATTPAAAPRTAETQVTVVHKHRFGDCEGTLRVAQGTLTYATSHKDDGFRLAFADIDAFDLDAGKNTLRIRRRGGKTWNFTTRDDATAALAAFHRDAARLRR
jgi:hypothetical protein